MGNGYLANSRGMLEMVVRASNTDFHPAVLQQSGNDFAAVPFQATFQSWTYIYTLLSFVNANCALAASPVPTHVNMEMVGVGGVVVGAQSHVEPVTKPIPRGMQESRSRATASPVMLDGNRPPIGQAKT